MRRAALSVLTLASLTAVAACSDRDRDVTTFSGALESDLLAYEPFDAPPGALHGLADGEGWSGPFSQSGASTAVPGYNIAFSGPGAPGYPLLVATGNHAVGGVDWGTSGRSLDLSPTGRFAAYLTEGGRIGASGTTLWIAAVLSKNEDTEDESEIVLHSGLVGSGFGAQRLSLGFFGAASQQNGARYWGIRVGSGSPVLSQTPIAAGEAVLLVVRVDFGATTTATLFVNPPLLGGPPPSDPAAEVSTNELLEIASVGWYAGSGPAQGTIDEVRIGRTFASVTPATGAPSCADGLRDGTESDVDCGGDCSPASTCGLNKRCGADADCASGSCTAGVCVSSTGGGTSPFASEAFEGAPGPLWHRGGGTGWASSWSVANASEGSPHSDYRTQAASLSFANLATSGGRATGGSLWNGSGRALDVRTSGPFRSFVVDGQLGKAGSTVWFSALVRKDTADEDDAVIVLHRDQTASYLSQPVVSLGYFGAASHVAGQRYWGLRFGHGDVRLSGVPVVIGQTALLVARIDLGPSPTVRLYVNPGSLGGAAPVDASVTASVEISLAFSKVGWYPGKLTGHGGDR